MAIYSICGWACSTDLGYFYLPQLIVPPIRTLIAYGGRIDLRHTTTSPMAKSFLSGLYAVAKKPVPSNNKEAGCHCREPTAPGYSVISANKRANLMQKKEDTREKAKRQLIMTPKQKVKMVFMRRPYDKNKRIPTQVVHIS